jgi:hypothetical protein
MRRGRKTLDIDDVLQRVGTPWNGPRQRPAAIWASAVRAAANARSGVSLTKALNLSSYRSMRASNGWTLIPVPRICASIS